MKKLLSLIAALSMFFGLYLIRLRRGEQSAVTFMRAKRSASGIIGTMRVYSSKETSCSKIQDSFHATDKESPITVPLSLTVSYLSKPRWLDRDFVERKIRVRIVETERTKERSTWQWHISCFGHSLEGYHQAPPSLNTEIVLLAITRNVSDPANRSGPDEWNDAWERRLLWNEMQSIRREVLKNVDGESRTLN